MNIADQYPGLSKEEAYDLHTKKVNQEWYKRNKVKVAKKRKIYRKEYRKRLNERKNKDYAKNRHKHYARNYVACALFFGDLVRKPCEICGDKNTQAHHDDYSKPLDVRWLCRSHHMMFHRNQ